MEDITFENVFSYANLYEAYKKCRRNVGWKHSTQSYKSNACINIRKTQRDLLENRWKSRGFIEFDLIDRGKKRHIRSVHITERVVQRCLCDHCLTPLLTKSLIPDNSASQTGKGMDYAVKRLVRHLQRHYSKYGTEGYILLFDFSKFFDSISHDVAFEIIDKRVSDERLRALSKYLISMFGVKGLGLGSQVSQTLAITVPDRMDHVIKEQMHCKGYGRYMDDGYIIHPDKEYLKKCLEVIRREASAFGVNLNEKKTQIVKLDHGFTFLKIKFLLTDSGRIIKRLSRVNVVRQRRKLKKLAGKIPTDDLVVSFESWLGHARRCKSWRTQQSMKAVLQECVKQ